MFETGKRLERRLGQHDAHAHQLVGDRNQPEPAEILPRDDTDVARAPGDASLTRHARIVREHSDVGKARLVNPKTELAREQGAAAGRVNESLGPHWMRSALGALDDCGHTVAVKGHIHDAMPFADLGAAGGGMPQQQLVKCRPRHLPGLRRRDPGRDAEVGVPFDPGVRGHERGAPLLREPGLPDEIVRADRGEHVVDRRQERFANVEARELVPFEERHAPPGPREPRGGRGPRRPAADDEDIAVEGRIMQGRLSFVDVRHSGGGCKPRAHYDASYGTGGGSDHPAACLRPPRPVERLIRAGGADRLRANRAEKGGRS